MKKIVSLTLVLTFVAATIGIVYANTPSRTPDGFDNVLVFIAAGRYDSSTGPTAEELWQWFHFEVMERDTTEFLQEMANAVSYFDEMFGPGLPLPMPFASDPRQEYRAYHISGMDAPSEGWVVRDGGFMVFVASDMELKGEWGDPDGDDTGTWVPGPFFLVYGEYNIDVTGPGESGKHPAFVEPLIIHYESAEPIIPEINGGGYFRCSVYHESWGWGLAQGVFREQPEDGGPIVQINTRNVLTFPPLGPSIDHTIDD